MFTIHIEYEDIVSAEDMGDAIEAAMEMIRENPDGMLKKFGKWTIERIEEPSE